MTFADKLDQMRSDLASIAYRMNLDQSESIATEAQAALNAVTRLSEEGGQFFEDLDWKWKPEKTPRRT